MLGRLLHTLGPGGPSGSQSQPSSHASRPVSSLESVHEDIHTRNLLFPDAQTLFQQRNDQVFPLSTAPPTPSASSTSAFDYSEDAGIEAKDVRVIVMQDANGQTNASLLYDSHPAPSTPSSERTSPTLPSDTGRRAPVSRKSSLVGQSSRPVVIQGGSPQPRQGAFDRRASLHSRTYSQAESETQRAAREYREELATFSGSIFGNAELMAYKGTSTKVHVIPSDHRGSDHPSSALGDGRSSIGRSGARSARLSQSFSSQAMSPSLRSPHLSQASTPRYKKVLITRLFPVNLHGEEADLNVTPHSRFSDDNTGFPFPATGEDGSAMPRKKKPQPRQRRTPMYAIVLVVQIPVSRPHGPGRSGLRESSSYTESDMFPSSYSSARPSALSMSGSGGFGDLAESIYSLDLEDRVDLLTQHWDIIMRAMTHMQSVTATTVAALLRQADIASPDTALVSGLSGASLAERRGAGGEIRVKQPKSTTKWVVLPPNCLAENAIIGSQVDSIRNRIVTGLSASRVVTGQGRWGIWRDEAIWASRWSASIDVEPFFYNLMTGFLATHTDWLQALCPPSYRRRFFLSRQKQADEDLSLPSRTIVVSNDKMAARRLIFLLSAFLPANQHLPAHRAHRPSTSTSVGNYSSSPPNFVIPVLREESLRRKMNRRTGAVRASHTRTVSQNTKAAAIPATLAHLSMERSQERRASDAASIRPTSLAMPGNDPASRKSSAATTTTVMPEPTIPHFSSVQRADSRRRPRPNSSNSVAADDLMRSLKRSDSQGQASTGSNDSPSHSSKWGSVLTGLWSARRRGSSNLGSFSHPSDPKSPANKVNFNRSERLSGTIREHVLQEEVGPLDEQNTPKCSDARDMATTPRDPQSHARHSSLQVDRTPDPTGAFQSPVKTSINVDDGVIDVEIPFPDYITSFESAISSPSSSGYLSTPGGVGGVEAFEYAARVTLDGDLPLNAAGWLRQYHPDFALQAIPPQEDLIESVKASLRAEPTPAPLVSSPLEPVERWVDVGSVMIADTINNSVTRILYRRLVKPKSQPSDGNMTAGLHSTSVHTPSILPYEIQLEEEWIEEQIVKPDDTLVDALNKVVDSQPELTKVNSSSSSTTRGDRPEDEADQSHTPQGDNTYLAPIETPRLQCKTVVLSALEDTIREVIDNPDKKQEQLVGPRRNILRAAVRSWVSELDVIE